MEVLLDNILNIGDDEFYRASRYESPLVAILVNSKDNSAYDTQNLTIIFLTHTDYQHSVAFLDKVKEQLDFTYTMSEFDGSEFDFIHDLYVNNIEKHKEVCSIL